MSEKLNKPQDNYENKEFANESLLGEEKHHRLQQEIDTTEIESTKEELFKNAKSEIEKNTIEKNETLNKISKLEKDNSTDNQKGLNFTISKDTRKIGLNKELKHVRSKLNTIDKTGSKVIHNDIVQKISEPIARTVARPIPLLLSGVLGFVGTILYYIFTKYFGVEYNFIVYLLFFVVGFLSGILIDIIAKLIRKTS